MDRKRLMKKASSIILISPKNYSFAFSEKRRSNRILCSTGTSNVSTKRSNDGK